MLWWEWTRFLATLLACVAAARLGWAAWKRSPKVGTLAAVAAGVVGAVAASAHYPPVRTYVGALVSQVGGEGVIACLCLFVLLGVAWASGGRRANRPLLIMAAVLGFAVVSALAAAPLAWRYLGQRQRANYPDANGVVQQSTGMTCAPAAAAMLLHYQGIRCSEGTLAELAGTNPLIGTDEFLLARALGGVAVERGIRAMARRIDYAQAVKLARPFVAYIRRPGVGGHAILVLTVGPVGVEAIDPLTGSPESSDRTTFEAEWGGVAVWIESRASVP
jgi:hypothetical protein